MISIISAFGGQHIQDALYKDMQGQNMFFSLDDCSNGISLIMAVEQHPDVDVIIIGHTVVKDIETHLSQIREITKTARIVLLLNGRRNQYIQDQYEGYNRRYKVEDILFEGDGIDRLKILSILTKYLQNEDVEEVNINAWNCIEVIYPDRVELLEETFVSPDDCMDKIKKMVWLGGSIIDGSNPKVDSFIGEGVRISALIPPCVDSKTGGVASIRRQKENVITRRLMIEYGSATPEELAFLPLCINNGVSLAIAGSTGSGKTTDLAYLISCLDKQKRIYTIEDTRELNIAQYENGRMTNRVVQTLTKDAPNPITMDDLLKEALRFHPYAIIPAEMRGAEAMTAVEAGRTGHVIISTLHANSAVDAYNRILSMCVATGLQLSENKILEFILEAIPVVLFKRQLPDGRRVYDEIFEGTGIKDGKVIGNTLYKYEIEENIYGADGRIEKVIGHHKKVSKMSDELLHRLRCGGASEDAIKQFM